MRLPQGGEDANEINRTCLLPGEEEKTEVHYEILRLKMMLKDEGTSHDQITQLSTRIKHNLEDIFNKIRLKVFVDKPKPAQKTTRCIVR